MSSPIQLIPHDDEDDLPIPNNNNNPVIENISTLNINTTTTTESDGRIDEIISLSSDTSATSLASALSDGAPRPRSATRPRSTSLLGLGRPNGNSTPRSRPRSNPRTRTPMRRESPLLVTGRVVDGGGGVIETATGSGHVIVAVAEEGNAANPNGGNATTASVVRNIFHARRNRAGSIPEEDEEATFSNDAVARHGATTNDEPSNANANANPNPAPRAAGHYLARASSTAIPRTDRRSANPTRSRNAPVGPSLKQRPSHRKLRRWNNDRFVGTSSERAHVLLQEGGGGDDDDVDVANLNWKEHYMPHYPLEYRSEFAKLSTDESESGRNVRDRFVRGEVARGNHRRTQKRAESKEDDSDERMERDVLAGFRKMGIAPGECTAEDGMGERMFRTLRPRIRSVVSRSCALVDARPEEHGDADPSSGDDDDHAPSFASRLVATFESYLVSLALAGSEEDVVAPSAGYPPVRTRRACDLFDEVFSSPPRVVIRNGRRRGVRAHSPSHSSSRRVVHRRHRHRHHHPHAVVVPTVHFYFSADDATGAGADDGRVRSSAFCRILLYAVCQFHGLESSSSVIGPRKGKRGSKSGMGKGGGGGGVKVVTIQGGVLLAPALKLLDYVE
mmetsp:Transcript_7810/g.16934  ORF Transcript_7810/g.16934 Transcript_7810/m.16934 type:complete len:618 (-) Transcript_7810:120-1973(-)